MAWADITLPTDTYTDLSPVIYVQDQNGTLIKWADGQAITADSTIRWADGQLFVYYYEDVGAARTVEAVFDALIQKGYTKTAALDALIKRTALTKTSSLDAMLQKGFTETTAIDAVVQKLKTVIASLDALLQIDDQAKTASLDALIRKTGFTSAASLDALVQKALSQTLSLDAIIIPATTSAAQVIYANKRITAIMATARKKTVP